MRADMREDICIGKYIDISADMCGDVCTDMRADLCVDMCVNMCKGGVTLGPGGLGLVKRTTCHITYEF